MFVSNLYIYTVNCRAVEERGGGAGRLVGGPGRRPHGFQALPLVGLKYMYLQQVVCVNVWKYKVMKV